jgi:hypothetical protein
MLVALVLVAPASAGSPHDVADEIEARISTLAHTDVTCDLVRLDPTEALLLDGLASPDGQIALAGSLITGLKHEVVWREALHTLAHECWHQMEFVEGVEQPSNPSQLARLEGVADAAAEVITRWWCRTRTCIGRIEASYPHFRPARARAKTTERPLAWLRDYALSGNRVRGRMWADANPRRAAVSERR